MHMLCTECGVRVWLCCIALAFCTGALQIESLPIGSRGLIYNVVANVVSLGIPLGWFYILAVSPAISIVTAAPTRMECVDHILRSLFVMLYISVAGATNSCSYFESFISLPYGESNQHCISIRVIVIFSVKNLLPNSFEIHVVFLCQIVRLIPKGEFRI